MELKYVGAKPKVSQHGVNFDQTKPDKYTFLSAAVELLEALSFDSHADKSVYLYHPDNVEYTPAQLLEMLKKHCKNIEEIFSTREEKTSQLIEKYTDKVKNNANLTPDERTAWLGNIKIMQDYYLQYVTNESAYNCALKALADKIHDAHIEEITFPLGKNYGLVFSHLLDVLRDHKPPYDATITMIEKDGQTVGKIDMNRPKPLSS